MSHEIRTPMNGIMGMIDIARLNLDDKDKITDCLDKMEAFHAAPADAGE